MTNNATSAPAVRLCWWRVVYQWSGGRFVGEREMCDGRIRITFEPREQQQRGGRDREELKTNS